MGCWHIWMVAVVCQHIEIRDADLSSATTMECAEVDHTMLRHAHDEAVKKSAKIPVDLSGFS